MRKLHALILSTIFISHFCVAQDQPKNQLQIDYQNSLNKADFINNSLSSVYQISEATYHCLDTAFNGFYQKLTFQTSIKDSTFDESSHYEIISVPVMSTSNDFIQLEVFGKLSDPNTTHYSNMTPDHTLYEYSENSEVSNMYGSDIGLGAGISFKTSPFSKVKVVISDRDLPGYGASQALIGFESQF